MVLLLLVDVSGSVVCLCVSDVNSEIGVIWVIEFDVV